MLYAAGSVYDVSVDADVLCGLAWSGDLLWFADAGRERIVAVAPHSGGAEVASVACPGLRCGLATVGGNLVYTAGLDHRLHIVDPATGELVAQVRNPRPGMAVTGMEGGRHGLWLGYGDLLDLRNQRDFSAMTTFVVNGRISGITATDRYVIYADRQAELITLVDSTMQQVALPVNVHGSPTGLSWDGARIWYGDSSASRLRAIDVPGVVPPAPIAE
jgi:hypothetical protein